MMVPVKLGRTVALFLLLGTVLTSSLAQEVCDFKMNNTDSCRAKMGFFKCGVYLFNVTGAEEYTYVEGLPDIHAKADLVRSPNVLRSLGFLSRRDFDLRRPRACRQGRGLSMGNARCFIFFMTLRRHELDSCDVTFLNDKPDMSIGDMLCQRIDSENYVPKDQDAVRGAEIVFRYSACMQPWEDVNNQGDALRMREPLCCRRNQNGLLKFEHCNGTALAMHCGPPETDSDNLVESFETGDGSQTAELVMDASDNEDARTSDNEDALTSDVKSGPSGNSDAVDNHEEGDSSTEDREPTQDGPSLPAENGDPEDQASGEDGDMKRRGRTGTNLFDKSKLQSTGNQLGAGDTSSVKGPWFMCAGRCGIFPKPGTVTVTKPQGQYFFLGF